VWPQNEVAELVFILVGGLAATGLFLMGLVAYQHGHGFLEKHQEQKSSNEQVHGNSTADAANSGAATGETLPSMEKRQTYPPQFQLCDSLVVPAGKRLVCRVECRLHRERQNLEFDITSSPSRGQKPLLQVQAAETTAWHASRPRVFIAGPEYHKEGGPLAILSTEDLYKAHLSNEERRLSVLGCSGIFFGTIRKSGSDYLLIRDDSSFITFAGRFREHDVRVLHGDRVVAIVEAVDAGSYQVSIESGVDAGLVLLGLLAIDKCEQPPVELDSDSTGLADIFKFGG